MQGVSRPSPDTWKVLYTGVYNAIYAVGHHMLQTQKSPHEGGYEDATKFFFFTVSLSSDG